MELLQFPNIDVNVTSCNNNTPFHLFCKSFPTPSELSKVNLFFLFSIHYFIDCRFIFNSRK